MYNPDDKASEHFTWKNLMCKCGCGFGLKPGDIDPRLIEGIQFIRNTLGEPLYVSSCCRCPKDNKRVKGKPGSQHLLGKAADLYLVPATTEAVTRIACAARLFTPFRTGGIIQYPKRFFVHVDTRDKRYHATM